VEPPHEATIGPPRLFSITADCDSERLQGYVGGLEHGESRGVLFTMR
jgi:hypothetical protein